MGFDFILRGGQQEVASTTTSTTTTPTLSPGGGAGGGDSSPGLTMSNNKNIENNNHHHHLNPSPLYRGYVGNESTMSSSSSTPPSSPPSQSTSLAAVASSSHSFRFQPSPFNFQPQPSTSQPLPQQSLQSTFFYKTNNNIDQFQMMNSNRNNQYQPQQPPQQQNIVNGNGVPNYLNQQPYQILDHNTTANTKQSKSKNVNNAKKQKMTKQQLQQQQFQQQILLQQQQLQQHQQTQDQYNPIGYEDKIQQQLSNFYKQNKLPQSPPSSLNNSSNGNVAGPNFQKSFFNTEDTIHNNILNTINHFNNLNQSQSLQMIHQQQQQQQQLNHIKNEIQWTSKATSGSTNTSNLNGISPSSSFSDNEQQQNTTSIVDKINSYVNSKPIPKPSLSPPSSPNSNSSGGNNTTTPPSLSSNLTPKLNSLSTKDNIVSPPTDNYSLESNTTANQYINNKHNIEPVNSIDSPNSPSDDSEFLFASILMNLKEKPPLPNNRSTPNSQIFVQDPSLNKSHTSILGSKVSKKRASTSSNSSQLSKKAQKAQLAAEFQYSV
ncbi:hypothetical protein CYY_005577 [Polysphondylium violaceum]|uniref:Uncharacterized protein n=1 Tax=Polysphondylium violaceum TaxID=133409 RepID=A0A8J4UZI6_9MYCE|nr:hypothetical protein CYY_005577 [Polysphondylium violaceum]